MVNKEKSTERERQRERDKEKEGEKHRKENENGEKSTKDSYICHFLIKISMVLTKKNLCKRKFHIV